MTTQPISRRQALSVALAGAAATTTLMAPDTAEAGRYRTALDHLRAAHHQLRRANRHAGGHRAKAVKLVERAIHETRKARRTVNW